MTIYPLDSGSRKITVDLFAKSGGSWRTIQTAHIKDSGSWRQVHGIPRALMGQGGLSGPTWKDTLEYVTISTTGNGISFGSITKSLYGGFCSSLTRGLYAGGTYNEFSINPPKTEILYNTILTLGGTSTFGNLINGREYTAGFSSNTRGLFSAGSSGSFPSETFFTNIEYVTIASTGNATSFGSVYEGRTRGSGFSSITRGIAMGGAYGNTYRLSVEYVTIATTGNASLFGTMSTARDVVAGGFSSGVRGGTGGGRWFNGSSIIYLSSIEYVTIATTGNPTFFGNLIAARVDVAQCSSSIRGLIVGGADSGGTISGLIQYITIATTGNATNFGSYTTGAFGHVAVSNAHGGLT